jgi:hypothetical protein
VPHTGEVFLSITNVQWITALALVLTLLMGDPVGAWDWAGDIAVLVIAGLSGPLGLFLLPFFVFRAIDRATNASRVLLAVAAAVALVQGLQIYHNAAVAVPESHLGPFRALNFLAEISSRLPMALLGAQGWAYRVARPFMIGAGAAGISAAVAMALAGGRLVGATGFEPATSWSQTRRSTRLSYTPGRKVSAAPVSKGCQDATATGRFPAGQGLRGSGAQSACVPWSLSLCWPP